MLITGNILEYECIASSFWYVKLPGHNIANVPSFFLASVLQEVVSVLCNKTYAMRKLNNPKRTPWPSNLFLYYFSNSQY